MSETVKRGRGRPPLAEKAMTATERKRLFRQRQAEAAAKAEQEENERRAAAEERDRETRRTAGRLIQTNMNSPEMQKWVAIYPKAATYALAVGKLLEAGETVMP